MQVGSLSWAETIIESGISLFSKYVTFLQNRKKFFLVKIQVYLLFKGQIVHMFIVLRMHSWSEKTSTQEGGVQIENETL